jgi:putative DNA primase/helicase
MVGIFPPIPQFPNKDEAAAALGKIETLIETFPFITATDRSVALSAILTTLDRRVMRSAPMHAFTSPTAGTGKSLLVDVASILATGRRMPVISQGSSEEELEKRLGAAMLAGDAAISIDNCEHTLQGVFLCQVLTQPRVNVRVLGHSKNVETLTNTSIFATGNNLTIVGDLARRSLLCSLDAHCEHPEQRSFKTSVVDIAYRDRGPLVVAALTALRAWHVANQPNCRAGDLTVHRIELERNISPLGSFEDWSYRIRSPLIWLGHSDPCDTIAKIKENDPRLLALSTVMAQWDRHIGRNVGNVKTVQEVISYAINIPEFHVALLNVAAGRNGNFVSNDRLGRWLKRVEGRVVGELMFSSKGKLNGYPRWCLGEV